MSKLLDKVEELGANASSLAQGRDALLTALKPKAKKDVANLDLETALEQLREWLVELVKSERPPGNIRALNFSLFENAEGGFTLYATGARSYDPDDPDWACANDWWPEGRYANIDLFTTLGETLGGSKQAWEIAQAIAIILLKEFFNRNSREFQLATGLKEVYVTTGFDDGDLYGIKTPLTPKNV